jgi:hypothetical protein
MPGLFGTESPEPAQQHVIAVIGLQPCVVPAGTRPVHNAVQADGRARCDVEALGKPAHGNRDVIIGGGVGRFAQSGLFEAETEGQRPFYRQVVKRDNARSLTKCGRDQCIPAPA